MSGHNHVDTVLVDDTRDFKDGRPALTARTSRGAVRLLESLSGVTISELWLDFDLVGEDTSQPVVDHLVHCATAGSPQLVERIHVHSSNIRQGHRICAELAAAGYHARRSFHANMWVRATAASTAPPEDTQLREQDHSDSE